MNYRIAIIGSKEAIQGFSLLGVTTVSAGTTVTLATASSIADDEILVAFLSGKDDADMNVFSGDADASPPSSKQAVYSIDKTATVGEHLLKMRHSAVGSFTFEWVLYKVTPA